MINRYYNWYDNTGEAKMVAYALQYDLEHWHTIQKKPIMISEYGAGSITGLHKDPPVLWSEEYQVHNIHWMLYVYNF